MDILDRVMIGFQRFAEIARTPISASDHPSPAANVEDGELSKKERSRSAAFMRVNHAGEIAAQGLYLGQAMVARSSTVREHLLDAARSETAHLNWCSERLRELDSRISYLTPFWALGSFTIGFAVGLAGDRYSLGFVEETERQVGAHLKSHLEQLPEEDARSRAIVTRMRGDEDAHRRKAEQAGAIPLPEEVRQGMAVASRVMTGTAYWL